MGVGRFEKLGGCAGRYAWSTALKSGVAVTGALGDGVTDVACRTGAEGTGSGTSDVPDEGLAGSGARCSGAAPGAGVCATAGARAGGSCSSRGRGAGCSTGVIAELEIGSVGSVGSIGSIGSDGATGMLGLWLRKKSAQVASTEVGSASYC